MKESEELKKGLLRERYFHRYWHAVAVISSSVAAGMLASLITNVIIKRF